MKQNYTQKLIEGNTDPIKKSAKKRVGYGAFYAIAVTFFAYFASQFFGAVILAFWARAVGRDAQTTLNGLETNTALQFGFFLIVEALTIYIIWWFLKRRGNSFKDIGLQRRPKKSDLGPAIGVFIVYFIALIAVTALASSLTGINTDQKQDLGFTGTKTNLELIMIFISLVILPPLAEEITVRGFLYTGLKAKFSKNIAAIAASVLFGIAHLQLGNGQAPLWIAAIDTMMLSMFLIYLREKTGALWSGMLVHGLKNGVAFLFLFVLNVSGI